MNTETHCKSQIAPFPSISFTPKSLDHQENTQPSPKKASKINSSHLQMRAKTLQNNKEKQMSELSKYRGNSQQWKVN